MTDERKTADGGELLRAMLEKRGYLYPHHRLMAAGDPELFARYDRYYDSLTLLPRALTEPEREVVWAGLIAASRAGEGAHHFRRGERFGVRREEFVAAAAIAAVAAGWTVLADAARDFRGWVPPDDAEAAYCAAFAAVVGPLPARLAHLVAIACHAAAGCSPGLRLHLKSAFALGAAMEDVAEVLTYVGFHSGMPTLIHAAEVWEVAARDGLCPQPWPDAP